MKNHGGIDNPIKPSSWRLINLALASSSFLSLAGSLANLPLLKPSHWLLSQWHSQSSMNAVSPIASWAIHIGVDLFLPASVLIVVFLSMGSHRKLGVPEVKYTTVGLTLAWVIWLVFQVVTLFITNKYGRGENAALVMFVMGMYVAPLAGPFVLILILWSLLLSWKEYKALYMHHVLSSPYIPVSLILWSIIPPVLLAIPALFDTSNPLIRTDKQNEFFSTQCQGVGVRLEERPIIPVRSLAYDWNPKKLSGRPAVERIEMDRWGRIRIFGGFPKQNSEEQQQKPVFEFTESRTPGHFGRAAVNPNAPYYHFPNINTNQPYYGVNTLSADVVAFIDVSKPEQLQKTFSQQGAVRYTITLTDQRTLQVLGVQNYVVDHMNKLACGANIGHTISQSVFIYDAINR